MSTKLFCCALWVVLSAIRCAAADAPTSKVKAASAGSLPKIETVLDRYVQALGGKAALNRVTSRVIKGEGESSMLPARAPWQFITKAPNKRLSILTVAGFGDVLDAFDGTHAWMKNPSLPVTERSGEELAKVRRDADFYRELKLKTLYPDLAVKSLAKVGEEETYVAESKPSAQSLERFYFGRNSGLLLRQDSETTSAGTRVESAMYFSDYRAVDGVKLAHTVRVEAANGAGGTPVIFTLKFTDVKQNVAVDDAQFRKPAE